MPAKKVVTTGRAKEFTINRGKWLQGKWLAYENDRGRFPASMLRDRKGMQCCLGFYTGACGVRGRTGVQSPEGLYDSERCKLDKKFFDGYVDSQFSSKLMLKNDDPTVTDHEREKYVKERFASIGVKVKFTGKYPYAK